MMVREGRATARRIRGDEIDLPSCGRFPAPSVALAATAASTILSSVGDCPGRSAMVRAVGTPAWSCSRSTLARSRRSSFIAPPARGSDTRLIAAQSARPRFSAVGRTKRLAPALLRSRCGVVLQRFPPTASTLFAKAGTFEQFHPAHSAANTATACRQIAAVVMLDPGQPSKGARARCEGFGDVVEQHR